MSVLARTRGTMTTVSPQVLHDLRNPLNQIIGYSEMLAEQGPGQLPGTSAVDLARIVAAGHRMLALIEENFTAGDEQHVRAVDIHRADRRPALAAVSAPMEPAVAPGLLLVVDDDAGNRDVLSRRLRQQGHTVETAASGSDALRLMQGTDFDLVLLDIMMPDIDGYEVLGHIRRDDRLRHVPVIMISAVNEVESVVRCIEAGAEDYLTKPFNPTLLKARISACLEKKRGRDRETILFEQLQQNYKRLQELEKARDDMRNMIVHDLRTPLTSVIVGVEMLQKHGVLSNMQAEMVDIAVRGGKTLLGMINDLLDVEKMESGSTQLQYEMLSPAELVSDAVRQVMSLAGEGHTAITVDVPATLPPFRGDAKKLSRTLVNLIANAIKFTPRGTVTVTGARQGEATHFAVADTGQGIPPEAFDRIFEKFGQLDTHKVGTGLGLAFCKLAVEAHGGTIAVDSTVGAGSVFSFSIPADVRDV